MSHPQPVTPRRRRLLSRRTTGRVVMVASVVAAITAVIGAIVAWNLVGNLRERTTATLKLVDSTLTNVQDSLSVAEEVITTVDGTIATLKGTMRVLSTNVNDAGKVLGDVANIAEVIPPSLDKVDGALVSLADAAGVIDLALQSMSNLPGINIDTSKSLRSAVASVRDGLSPISANLRNATTSIRSLATSSGELQPQLTALNTKLDELASSVTKARGLLAKYRTDASAARGLSAESIDSLGSQIGVFRILILILAFTIAVGQIATFRIGYDMANLPGGTKAEPDAGAPEDPSPTTDRFAR